MPVGDICNLYVLSKFFFLFHNDLMFTLLRLRINWYQSIEKINWGIFFLHANCTTTTEHIHFCWRTIQPFRQRCLLCRLWGSVIRQERETMTLDWWTFAIFVTSVIIILGAQCLTSGWHTYWGLGSQIVNKHNYRISIQWPKTINMTSGNDIEQILLVFFFFLL